MATLKLYLDTRRPKHDGTCSLRIQVNHHGSTAFISLSQSILASEWDAVRSRVRVRPDREALNDYLLDRLGYYNRLLKSILMSPDFRADCTARQLRDLMLAAASPSEPEPVTFSGVYHQYIGTLENRRTREIYETTWKRIAEFDASASLLTFADVTADWLRSFFLYLSRQSPSVNARNIHLRNIRAVFNYAIDEELTTLYPFRKFKIRAVETAKRDLSLDELRALFALNVQPWQQRYLDCFRLSFCLLGINIGDLLSLPSDCVHNGRIEFNRRKTHRFYSILVPPEAWEIINRYRGSSLLLSWCEGMKDYRYFMARMNRCLRQLHPSLTSYYARHTWATLAFRLGVSKDTISLALGHSFGSRVTSIYINTDLAAVDKANRLVLDAVFGNE